MTNERTFILAGETVTVTVTCENYSVADAVTKGIEVMMRGVGNVN